MPDHLCINSECTRPQSEQDKEIRSPNCCSAD
jgi:hypothetical protein